MLFGAFCVFCCFSYYLIAKKIICVCCVCVADFHVSPITIKPTLGVDIEVTEIYSVLLAPTRVRKVFHAKCPCLIDFMKALIVTIFYGTVAVLENTGSEPMHRQDRAGGLPPGAGARGDQILVLQRRTRAWSGHVYDRDRGE